jgi:hypothetical protein
VIARVLEGWAQLKSRYADLVAQYGYAAFAVWFSLFLLTFAGFYVAISQGVDPSGAASQAGTIGGAYLATQATKPARIVATLALTPIAVRVWHRLRPSP